MEQNLDHLIHDWNVLGEHEPRPHHRIELDDETLRDGLQSPSVHDPAIEEKLQILHYMARIGVDAADVGLPGAGAHVQKTVTRLVEEIRDQKLEIAPNCAARTHENDIRPIAEISQRTGVPIEVAAFIGSSPIRQFAEEWEIDWIIAQVEKATRFAVSEGLPVMLVTEDTTRARPSDIERIYSAAIRAGATRVCIADTVGHATPWGARNLVRFLRGVVEKVEPSVKIDWHGHNDRGLAVINSIAALQAGANRVHGCALGIGERVGNTPIDLLMVNLRLMGWIDHDLTALAEYVPYVSKVTRVPFVDQYPVFGGDAFRTATGVHAAAIIKAHNKGADWLADRVYSAVPAGWFGLKQLIEIGPMSGLSNVAYWLTANGLPTDEGLAKRIFERAKASARVLSDDELNGIVRGWADEREAAAR
jgi:2-isopropylmalate synthase